ncbi:hypothetical protein [Ruminococcus flavefaciens]|uniref:hypothetical protein n=1 Tax=Ruminococcus flavefaciens TaxID=1265 RepID=UPI00048C9C8A|nr:hypothetical protein [Ruminococcus flavefaciens]
MKQHKKVKIIDERLNMVNIIIYSIILGILVNYISDSVTEAFGLKAKSRLIFGIISIAVLLVILLLHSIKRLSTTIDFKCTFIHDKNKDLVSIPEYKISEDMKEYLEASFAENAAIKNQWKNTKFNFIDIKNKPCTIVNELIEYCLLESFSTFISSYFNLLDENEKTITLNQKNIPEILLNNRFLKLFSEDMENRSVFINNSNKATISDTSSVCLQYAQNGAIYRRFDLTLPKGSKIYKDKDAIIVDTKLFKMTIQIIFKGLNRFIDHDLLKYYVKSDDPFDLNCLAFGIKLSVKYKYSAAFKPFDWKYYNWLSEYIERLENYCDIDSFYSTINWKIAKALLQIKKSRKK